MISPAEIVANELKTPQTIMGSSSPPKDDLYGHEHPTETPELISSSLMEFDKELDKVSANEKTAWNMALEKCPDQCGDAHKLMFLRCEVFNCDLAVIRLLNYWTKRLELFGHEKAFLPLTLDGAYKDDDEQLKIGFWRVTQTSDDDGRGILFIDANKLPISDTYDRVSFVRSLWYYAHAALEDEKAQRMGFVIMSSLRNTKYAQFDRKFTSMTMESTKGCIPLRIAAFQICYPPKFFKIVYPFMNLMMGARLRKRVKVNSGNEDKIVARLEQKYKIQRQNIPTEIGGELVLDHLKWLAERKARGL